MKFFTILLILLSSRLSACCIARRSGIGGEMRIPQGRPLIVAATFSEDFFMDRDWFALGEGGRTISVSTRRLHTAPPFRVFDLSTLRTGEKYELRHRTATLCAIYACDGNSLTVTVDKTTPSGSKIAWRFERLHMNPQRAVSQPGLPFIIASVSASSTLLLEATSGARETLIGIARLDLIREGKRWSSQSMKFQLTTNDAGIGFLMIDNSTCGEKIPIEYGSRYELSLYDGRTVDLSPMAGWEFYVPKLDLLDAASAAVFAEHDRLARGASPESGQQAFQLTQGDAYRHALTQFQAWSASNSNFEPKQIDWRPVHPVLIPQLATAPQGLKH